MANTRNVGIWVNQSDRTNHETPTGRNDGFVSMVGNEITFHPPVDKTWQVVTVRSHLQLVLPVGFQCISKPGETGIKTNVSGFIDPIIVNTVDCGIIFLLCLERNCREAFHT